MGKNDVWIAVGLAAVVGVGAFIAFRKDICQNLQIPLICDEWDLFVGKNIELRNQGYSNEQVAQMNPPTFELQEATPI